MDLAEVLDRYHQHIVQTWAHHMLNDLSSRYSDEPAEELTPLIDRATRCFRDALVKDQSTDLAQFINFIAHKRLLGGFALSEVQRAFEQYRATVIPLLTTHIERAFLTQTLLRLHQIMVSTVTGFSTYFQDLHEEFLRNQASFLEQEVADRTRKLAESERKYKILVEDINDGYFVLVEGKIVYANKAFARMHGYDLEDTLGRHYLDFVAPKSSEAVETAYTGNRGGTTSASRLEYLRLHRDGGPLPTEIMAKLSSYAGQLATIGICRDISERVELERKTREAEKLNALARFAASLAHEINNPLTAIKMNIQMFSEGLLPEEARRKLLSSTLYEIDQIKRSITEMMNLTVPFRLKSRLINLRELIEGCLGIVEQRMAYQGVKVFCRLSAKMTEVWLDPERMEQALVNLLLNALDALPKGGRLFVSSRASWEKGQPWVHVRVADDGPGIPKEKRRYLFDPFFSQKAGGIGLGLGNVKKIVEAHGGRVVVTERIPKGVSFTLVLPQK
ncbi:MAG: PAS domain S-box protein [Desulfomonile tiedjei]|uniref:histidine kinase n=1 Tax=Desulfomonile tiedjei TaxID=2358 RepID=A0A9D6UWX2_9BACT|nr:PAS domain S-box protein [Desulfomonile tiedjei]